MDILVINSAIIAMSSAPQGIFIMPGQTRRRWILYEWMGKYDQSTRIHSRVVHSAKGKYIEMRLEAA